MKLILYGFAVVIAVFFLGLWSRTIVITPMSGTSTPNANEAAPEDTPAVLSGQGLPVVPESEAPTSSPVNIQARGSTTDMPKQQPMPNPSDVVKGIYVTGWSAGSASRIDGLLRLAQRTEINAMVVDVKDYSGHVSYKTGIPEVTAAGAENEIKILQPNAFIKKLHDAGIYVIGRQTVFQDPLLAKAHPEWALKNKLTGKTWIDNKGLAWMDVAAHPVWDYNVAIAKDAFERGFDEIQFDYIRFASDGALGNIVYPYWDEKTPRHKVIGQFFKYLRDNLPDKKISADFFGLTTVNNDDLGIGQVIEDAYANFDYVSPMVYPSHYAPGFLGYKQPAKYPYEVVKYSLEKALDRLITYNKKLVTQNASSSEPSSSTSSVVSHKLLVKLRPWLQDFDLGATYDAPMVKKQIQATYDALLATSTIGQVNCQLSTVNCYFAGWLLWDPSNTYTEGALEKTNN